MPMAATLAICPDAGVLRNGVGQMREVRMV